MNPSAQFISSASPGLPAGGGASAAIFESPTLKQPALTPTSSSNGQGSPKKKSSPKIAIILAAVIGVLLLLGAGGVGLYLSSQPQDVRQQASTPTGTARLTVDPISTNLTAGQKQSIPVKINLGGSDVEIIGVQYIIELLGNVPADLKFEPATLTGLSVVTNTVTGDDEKKLSVAFSTTPPATFKTNSTELLIGNITFTPVSAGQMSFQFDKSLSKIIKEGTGDDILRTPSDVTFTFTGGASPTLTPTPTATATARPSTIPSTSPIASTSATPTPSATASASPGTGGTTPSATPSVTPTATALPITDPAFSSSSSASASGSSGRDSTTLAGEDQPVSGSATQTLTLLIGGVFLMGTGYLVWRVPENT